jgi:hypothetical protein
MKKQNKGRVKENLSDIERRRIPMNRRKFIGISAGSLGGLLVTGMAYRFLHSSDPLDPFRRSTKKVLTARFGKPRTEDMLNEIQTEYASIVSSVPDIGGKQNMFTEWLDYGVYYLAVYRILKGSGCTLDKAGEIIFRTYEVMADYPQWFLNVVGKLKYGKSYVSRLRAASAESQNRKYPESWVCSFIDGNSRDFDYGLDITECGICKFYALHQASELAPYMCLSDFVVSKAFNRGLIRYHTLAEGGDRCDFRYKANRETFVFPLRDGWPPKFSILAEAGALSLHYAQRL